MIDRVRDKLRNFKPQEVVRYEDWKDIKQRYDTAILFIDPENTAYNILLNDLEEAKAVITENRIHEVHEVRVLSDLFHKIFITPRQEQLDELVGQVKYIKNYLSELQSWIDRKVELEKMEANGKVVIYRTPEEPIDERSK